jgi:Lrp/AsnC family transcriptional regulator, leucine-responsive regulatory protein
MQKFSDLDTTDVRLLKLLQADAARTNLELAEAAHLSPATALRRIARLRERGYVERTVAVLAPDALKASGVSLIHAVLEVSLESQADEVLRSFSALATAEPAVQQVYALGGAPDFLLVICVREMSDYQALARRLFSVQNGVRNIKTFFATRRDKFTSELPI